jgi:predicted dehydrogenase
MDARAPGAMQKFRSGKLLSMKQLPLLMALCLPMAAQQYKIAIVGLVHSHVWGHLARVARPDSPAKLVGIAEPNQELVAEARKAVGPDVPFFEDYRKMLDQVKPDIVWAFVENNRHLEVAEVCAPRKIQVVFEKPLASNYKEALAMERLAKQHGVRIMTNYQMAWWASNYAAKAQADSGVLGKVWRLHGVVGHGGPGSEGPRNRYFFEWLTDPVKNGAGALVDFGCYNALWSLWYLGVPDTVYATVNRLQPERFPKVEDNADLLLHYKDGVGVFEGSWDLPRGFQDLEVFGRSGSLYMEEGKLQVRIKGAAAKQVEPAKLEADRAEPVAYMVSVMKADKPLDGLVALPINVDVVRVIEAAKESVHSGKAEKLPGAR